MLRIRSKKVYIDEIMVRLEVSWIMMMNMIKTMEI